MTKAIFKRILGPGAGGIGGTIVERICFWFGLSGIVNLYSAWTHLAESDRET